LVFERPLTMKQALRNVVAAALERCAPDMLDLPAAAAALERGAPVVLVLRADAADPEQYNHAVEEAVAHFSKESASPSRRGGGFRQES
jgi:uncharacterized protein GlcG (DUF336 family)